MTMTITSAAFVATGSLYIHSSYIPSALPMAAVAVLFTVACMERATAIGNTVVLCEARRGDRTARNAAVCMRPCWWNNNNTRDCRETCWRGAWSLDSHSNQTNVSTAYSKLPYAAVAYSFTELNARLTRTCSLRVCACGLYIQPGVTWVTWPPAVSHHMHYVAPVWRHLLTSLIFACSLNTCFTNQSYSSQACVGDRQSDSSWRSHNKRH